MSETLEIYVGGRGWVRAETTDRKVELKKLGGTAWRTFDLDPPKKTKKKKKKKGDDHDTIG